MQRAQFEGPHLQAAAQDESAGAVHTVAPRALGLLPAATPAYGSRRRVRQRPQPQTSLRFGVLALGVAILLFGGCSDQPKATNTSTGAAVDSSVVDSDDAAGAEDASAIEVDAASTDIAVATDAEDSAPADSDSSTGTDATPQEDTPIDSQDDQAIAEEAGQDTADAVPDTAVEPDTAAGEVLDDADSQADVDAGPADAAAEDADAGDAGSADAADTVDAADTADAAAGDADGAGPGDDATSKDSGPDDPCSCGAACNGKACNDGSLCTTDDKCSAGSCAGTPVVCANSGPCTVGQCEIATGSCQIVSAKDGLACDDGKVCTTGDACSAGTCAGKAQGCDDGIDCTFDTCNGSGCVHLLSTKPCDDGDACTTGDLCAKGACSGLPILCVDGSPCTADGCDPAKGCVFVAMVGVACSDGSKCTTDDLCSGGKCVGGPPLNCDDGNPCTADTCSPTAGCNHEAAAGACKVDASVGTCVAGACCVPQCSGKACGPDGCGGVCGACAAGQTCQPDGTCLVDGCAGISYQGCCDAGVIKWCEGGLAKSLTCANAAPACGWDAANQFYNCVKVASVDPSGLNAYGCPGATCKAAAFTGCCAGHVCEYDSCGKKGAQVQFCAFGCDAATQKCYADPCQGVPASGVCAVDGASYSYCAAGSDGSSAQIHTEACKPYETCKEVGGITSCALKAGACEPGTAQCTGADEYSVCDDKGVPTKYACPGCKTHYLGTSCQKAIETTVYTATFVYDYKVPAGDLSDWSASVASAPLAFAAVYSMHKDASGTTLSLLDSTYTDEQGKFSILVAKNPAKEDFVAVMAARANGSQQIVLGVGNADVPAGENQVSNPVPADTSHLWSWSVPSSNWGTSDSWSIGIANGSGAARIFSIMNEVYGKSQQITGKAGKSVVAWLHYGSTWTCGACFGPWNAQVNNTVFDSQLWFGASDADEAYWSDAVTAHEMGHWAMASYGTSPNEGGTHMLGVPTFSGQAWSEGFATWHSSLVRNSPVYFDKQDGTFFWFNIDKAVYSGGGPLIEPDPQGDLLQKMDENRVAAIVWALTDTTTVPYGAAVNNVLFQALTGPHMNTAPFPRGYKRHVWTLDTSNYPPVFKDVVETSESAPMVADFLDALACLGVKSTKLQAAVQTYPFPVAAPLCP